MRIAVQILIIILVSLALTGCGSSSSTREPTATPINAFLPVPPDTPAPPAAEPTSAPAQPETEQQPEPAPQDDQATSDQGQPAQVINIVDGDTIDVIINGAEYRVRYILMDTPERGDPYFSEATEVNRQLVGGQTVYLVRDVSETDRYGRLLRYVYLEDGTFVNAEIVRRGYAQVATFPPDVSQVDVIRAAQSEAQAQGRGLWAGEPAAEEQPSAPAAPVTTAAQGANLRGGPSTDHEIVGGVTAGQALEVTHTNPAGDWYRLASGAWIFGTLVSNAPSGLPVTTNYPAPPQPQPVEQPQEPVQPEQPAEPEQPVEPTPVPQPVAVCDCSGNNYNCGDFGTWNEAQSCMNYCIDQGRGDIHRLDGDNDGVACEGLR